MDGKDDMLQETSPKLTYEDLLLFPDDGLRHELIDGVHYVTASPVTRHQRILRRLSYAIEAWLVEHPVGEMFFAPFDVVLSRFDVVVPDLIYISAERSQALDAKGMFAAPDLAVEILSPSTRRRDEELKHRLYERTGVSEYWLIDPDRDVVSVHRRGGEAFANAVTLSSLGGDELTSPLFPGFSLRLRALLAP
jgi:Uma2 family endonuclease